MAIRYFKPQGSPIKKALKKADTKFTQLAEQQTKEILDDLKAASQEATPENTEPLIEAMKATVGKVAKLQKEIDKVKDGRFETGNKVRLTLWLDKEVVEHFKAQGSGWQTRINEVLADYVKSQSK